MIALLALPVFLMGGLGRRVAGGAFEQWTGWDIGDLPVRLFYGVTVALAALIGGATWPIALAMVVAVWIGTTTGNFESLAMGVDGKYGLLHDIVGMTAHGILSAMPLSIVIGVAFHGLTWTAALGDLPVFAAIALSAAPSYYVGWRLVGSGSGNPWVPGGLKGGTEVAEVLWGGVTAVSVYLAFALS